jgi:hypothetical protein
VRRKVRRIVVMVVLVAVMTATLALSAPPAMAFIHTAVPAGDCAASENAADNESAEDAINGHNPAKAPVSDTRPIVNAPAPDTLDTCHHK